MAKPAKDKAQDRKLEQARPDEGAADRKAEHGGPRGLEPTRYGDWERNGRCIDF